MIPVMMLFYFRQAGRQRLLLVASSGRVLAIQVGNARLNGFVDRLLDLFDRVILVQLEDGDELARTPALLKTLPHCFR